MECAKEGLLDPGFALGGEGVEFLGTAVFDEALFDPGGELLLFHGPGVALRDRAEGAHEQRLQLEG